LTLKFRLSERWHERLQDQLKADCALLQARYGRAADACNCFHASADSFSLLLLHSAAVLGMAPRTSAAGSAFAGDAYASNLVLQYTHCIAGATERLAFVRHAGTKLLPDCRYCP
jgi:hypothetical protein